MKIMARPISSVLTILPVAVFIGASGIFPIKQAVSKEPEVSFSQDILPLFKWRCGTCHQPGGQGYEKSGVDLMSYQGVMRGTKFGPMIVPGDPGVSNLMLLLDWRVAPAIQMPHGKKQLSSCDRNAIRTWIRQGAKDN